MIHRHLSLALVLLAAAPAAAQPAKAQAETLFREGRDLMKDGKLDQACAAFESSQKLDPAVTTQLNLAACREKNGQLATAWGVFVDVQRQLRGATDDKSKQLLQVATQKAAALEPRLSKLTIKVAARVSGLEVVRDNDAVDAGAWDTALPIDGGTYTITARAPGHETWTGKVTVKNEGDAQTIEVPALAEAKVAATPPPPKFDEPAVRVAPEPARSNAMPLALTAGAVVLLGGSLGFELWGESTYDDAKKEPDPAKQDSLWSSANTKRYVAEGMLGAGVAVGAVAVWMWLRHPAATEKVAVTPLAGGGVAGLSLDGRF